MLNGSLWKLRSQNVSAMYEIETTIHMKTISIESYKFSHIAKHIYCTNTSGIAERVMHADIHSFF